MLNPKPIELGGRSNLDKTISDLGIAIHERMMIENPDVKILNEIDELIMRRNRLSRRLAEIEANKESVRRGY